MRVRQKLRLPAAWGSSRGWVFLTMATSVLVCASVVGLYLSQDRVLRNSTQILRDLRQARIDLYRGVMHAMLGGEPGSAWERERGQALMQQALGAFERTLPRLDDGATRQALRRELQRFLLARGTPDEWTDVQVRVRLSELDVFAARVEQQARLQLQLLRERQRQVFLGVLASAAGLLALVSLGAVRSARREAAAAAAQRESELRLQQLAENVREVFWLREVESGRILYVSPAYATIWGRSRESLMADPRSWLDGLHADDRQRVSERVGPQQPTEDEYRVVRPDGSTRWIRSRTFPVHDDAGRITRIAGVTADITELKTAEARLKESLALLQATFESTDNGVLVVARDGRALFWNERVPGLLGGAAALQAGREAAVLDALAAGGRVSAGSGGEELVSRPDGSFIERHCQPMTIDGQDAGRVWTFRDVTARERALAEAESREEELEARVRERTQAMTQAYAELQSFSDAVSHDLRAPLAALQAYGYAVLRKHGPGLPEEVRGLVQRMFDAGQQMGEMIEGLLDLSRHARAPVHRRPLDIGAVARQAFELQAPRLGSPDVRLTVQEGLQGTGDPILVATLLQNLVGNALKYSRDRRPAQIEIGVKPDADAPAFFVRDNGAGFDSACADRLFKPFSRLHRASEFEGHGMGLATASRIVARHGGRIWAEGAPGAGATFWFTLGP